MAQSEVTSVDCMTPDRAADIGHQRGFFHHIEKLKYEHHLKECLKQMHAGEDLEKEDFESRRHKYIDDEGGPLSPIEEPLTEDEATNPESECDIKLVTSVTGISFIKTSIVSIRNEYEQNSSYMLVENFEFDYLTLIQGERKEQRPDNNYNQTGKGMYVYNKDSEGHFKEGLLG
ncbi:TATA-box binding protein associated factor RNA polymerase I D [Cricetulus griseus]